MQLLLKITVIAPIANALQKITVDVIQKRAAPKIVVAGKNANADQNANADIIVNVAIIAIVRSKFFEIP